MKAHVPEKHLPELDQRLGAAYQESDYEAAKKSLEDTANWLTRINPDAAASSAESKAVARCQPFSRLLNLWCANNGLEASNEWRDNVLEEPPTFQLHLGQSRVLVQCSFRRCLTLTQSRV